jgi:transposase
MARPYSLDLRERAVAAAHAGRLTRAEVAEQFVVSEGTLYDWLRRAREQGSVAPRPHAGGRPVSVDEVGEVLLCSFVAAENDLTLAELGAHYHGATGVALSQSALWRALERLGLAYKKSR